MKPVTKFTRQSGQSIAEFLAAVTFFILPLFFGMTYLAKVGETSTKTHNAARYSAWERTVYLPGGSGYITKSDNDIATEANNRIFRQSSEPLHTEDDRTLVGMNDMEMDPIYYLHERDYNDLPIYGERTFSNASPSSGGGNGGGNSGPTPIVNITMSRADLSSSSISGFTANIASAFGLDINHLYAANVSTPLVQSQYLRPSDPNQAAAFDSETFASQSVNAIYTGSWNARTPVAAEDSVRGVIPSGILEDLSEIFELAGELGAQDFAPYRGETALNFGKVDPNRVPCQRLAGSVGRNNC